MYTNHLKIIVSVYFISLASVLFAGKIVVKEYPKIENIPEANIVMKIAVDQMLLRMNDVSFISAAGHQPSLAQGFGDASSFVSSSGNLYTNTSVEYFSLGFGLAASAQLPPDEDGVKDQLEKIGKDLDDGSDSYFGFAVGASLINLTVPVKTFAPGSIFEDLNLWTKFGYRNDNYIDKFNAKGGIFGFGALYKLTDEIGKVDVGKSFLFKVRPVTINTGMIYTYNEITYSKTVSKSFTKFEKNFGTFKMTNDLDQMINSDSYVFPAEISSSVNFLYFLNLFAGFGFDLAVTKANITFDSDTTLDFQPIDKSLVISEAVFEMEESTTSARQTTLKPKIFGGFGIDVYDILMTEILISYYYPSGVLVGVSVGAGY